MLDAGRADHGACFREGPCRRKHRRRTPLQHLEGQRYGPSGAWGRHAKFTFIVLVTPREKGPELGEILHLENSFTGPQKSIRLLPIVSGPTVAGTKVTITFIRKNGALFKSSRIPIERKPEGKRKRAGKRFRGGKDVRLQSAEENASQRGWRYLVLVGVETSG